MSSFPVLKGREAILTAYGDEPFLECFVNDSAEGVVADGAAVWLRRNINNHTSVMCDGAPKAVAAILADTAKRWHPSRITVPKPIFESLPTRWRPETIGCWHWFYTRSAPPKTAAEQRVEWLAEHDFDSISRLLDLAFPHASNRPDPAAGGRRWFGVRGLDDSIVACGLVSTSDGVGPMLGSIAVHPQARRQGLGAGITSWVTRELLSQGNSLVALGSYAADADTHRLYRRLGYRDTRVLTSGQLQATTGS